MKRYIYLLLVFMITNNAVLSQVQERKYCGASQHMQDISTPEKQQILDQLEIFTQEFIANIDENRLGGPYIIPVVVHVIHNYGEENISYERIDHGIYRINEDFQGINDDLSEVIAAFDSIKGFPNFEFRLATKDPNGNCTYGVTKTATEWTEGSGPKVMALVNWDDKKYVNIYVVNSFDDSMSSAAAYATKPGNGSPDYGDYIFCRYDYFGDWSNGNPNPNNNWARHTLPHEMGHFFNLDHPWGGSNSPGEEGNCSIDDGVVDTPPTLGTDGNQVGCPLDQATCDGSLDNVQNIMDYSSCAHMFTQGQSDRMLAAANSLAGNRSYLWQPQNLIDTGTDDESLIDAYADCAPIPDFKSNTELGCSGAVIQFENFTYNYRNSAISYEWTFEGGSPSTSNLEEPNNIMYENPGTYSVTLKACRGSNCNEVTATNFITILSQTDVNPEEGEVGFSQGFEDVNFPNIDNNGVLETWWVGDDKGEEHWQRSELVSTEGNSSFRIKSQNYSYDRESHEFSTPELNMSDFVTNSSDPLMLCFDYAYARRLPYNAVDYNYETGLISDVFSIHHDELLISYKNCDDNNWIERPRLSTRPGYSGSFGSQQQNLITTDKIYFNSFVPAPDEWLQHCVTIQQLAGAEDAMIKFEFIGTGQGQELTYLIEDSNGMLDEIESSTIGGNWLYIDNIMIGNSSVIENTDETVSRENSIQDIDISPNPAFIDQASISFKLFEESRVKISMSNLLGLNIGSQNIELAPGEHNYKLSDLFLIPKEGAYVVMVETFDSKSSKIIIIR